MEKPQNLYHFTTAENAIKYILPRCQIRMNVLENMNDPKDNLRHLNSERLVYKGSDFLEISRKIEVSRIISKRTRIASFSIDVKKNGFLISGFEKQRMWTQYSDQHTGVCIVIDYNKFLEENKSIIQSFDIRDDIVSYSEDFCLFPDLSVLNGTRAGLNKEPDSIEKAWERFKKNEHAVKDYFFKKGIDWVGENEYRFLTFHDLEDEILLSFKNSLKMVVTGLIFSHYYLPSIEAFIKDKNKIVSIDFDDYHTKLKLSNIGI